MTKTKVSLFIKILSLALLFGPQAIADDYKGKASDVRTNTSAFNNVLSASENTVQKALDILDNVSITASSSAVLTNKSFSDNVGIGTQTPQSSLDIVGNVKSSKSLSLGPGSMTGTWSKVGGDGVNGSWSDSSLVQSRSMTVWNGKLIVSAVKFTTDADIWAFDKDTNTWEQIAGNGMGWNDGDYNAVMALGTWNGYLVAGMGEDSSMADVWIYDGTTWSQIGGDSLNGSWGSGYFKTYSPIEYRGNLVIGLGNTASQGEVWLYNGTSWTKIADDPEFGAGREAILSLVNWHDKLCAGLGASNGDADIYCWDGVSTWTPYATDSDFGSANEYEQIHNMVVYKDRLCVGMASLAGDADVFCSNKEGTSWTKIGGDGVNGSWSTTYEYIWSMVVHDGILYVGLNVDGEVWAWNDSGSWVKVGGDGVNSSWATGVSGVVMNMSSYAGNLYAGNAGGSGNAEVWEYLTEKQMTLMKGDRGLNIGSAITVSKDNRVGIFENSPDRTLDVNGDFRVDGLLDLSFGKMRSNALLAFEKGGYMARGTSDTIAIGTSTSDAKVEIFGNGTSSTKALEVSNVNGSNIATFLDNGSVGIGTPNPLATNSQFYSVLYSNADALRESVVRNPNTGTSAAAGFELVTADSNGFFRQYPTNSTFGDIFAGRTVLQNESGSGLTLRTSSGDIRFLVSNTNMMRMTAAGNFGIGTISPQAKLQVFNGNAYIGNGTFDNNSANEDLYVEGNLEVDGTIYGDGSGLTGLPSGGGWSDGGTNIYTSTTTDTVGVGTTTPNNTTLEIVKQSTKPPLKVSSSATGDGDFLTITSGGAVGLGTTNPLAPNNQFYAVLFKNANALREMVVMNPNSGTSAATGFEQKTADTNAFFRAHPTNYSISDYAGKAVLKAEAGTGLILDTASGTPIQFSISASEKARLDATGNFGISTVNPVSKMQVVGTVNATSFVGSGSGLTSLNDDAVGFDDANSDFTATEIGPAIEEFVSVNGSGINSATAKVDWTQLGNVPAGFADGTDDGGAGGTPGGSSPQIQFNNGGSFGGVSGSGADTNGNIGIGTTGPTQKLQVVGTIAATAFTGDGANVSNVNAITGDSATAFFSSGAIERARGGTGADTSAYGTGILGSDGSNNTIDIDTIAEVETAIGGTNIITDGEIDTSAEIRGILTDESGTGAAIFAGGNIGAATATTPAEDDNSTNVATTAYVQTEISGLGSGAWVDGGTNVYVSPTTDNVGIGTTTPSTTLEIVKQGSQSPLMVSATPTGDGNYLIVNSAGNVGMGTVLPSAILDVVSANYPVGEFTRTSSSTNTVSGVMKFKAKSSSVVTDGYGVNFGAFIEGSGISETQIGELAFVRDGADNSGAITFRPYASGSANERMRVSSNGNVGVGTARPQTPFQVAGDTKIGNGTFNNTSANEDLYAEGNLEVDGTIYGDGSGLTNLPSTSGGWSDGATNVYTSTTTDLVGIGTTTPSTTLEIVKQGSSAPLMVSSTPTGDGNVLIITSSGNVGIGTLLPRGTLDLGPTGTIYAQTIAGPTGPTILGTSNNVGIGTITAGSLLTIGSTGQTTVTSAGVVSVPDDAYASGWNGSTAVPTKNAVYDKIETLGAGYWTDAGPFTYLTTTTDNVGIGTVAPDQRLKVEGSSAANISTMVRNSNSSGLASVKVWNSANLGFEMVATGSGYAVPSTYGVLATAGESLSFGESDGTINMRINPAGTVRFTPTDTPDACNAGNEGSLYYDNSLNEFCDCDGSSWAQVDGGGAC